MASATLKRLGSGFMPLLTLSVLLLISLSLMSAGAENSEQFGHIFFFLLLINVLGLVALLVLIGANLIRLVRQFRKGATGSRLTVRLVIIFVILALLPVTVVYYFSLGFIQRGIDSWFDVRFEQALDDSLALTRLSLDERKRELLRRSEKYALQLAAAPRESLATVVNEIRLQSEAEEMVLLDVSGKVMAFSNIEPDFMPPSLPEPSILNYLQEQGSYIALERNEPNSRLLLRIIVPVAYGSDVEGSWWLQTIYPMSEEVSALADQVQSAAAEYKRLTQLRDPLKFSFTLTLSLVLLLSCLTAVWAAFFSARRLVAPIRALAIGTRAVASGNYKRQLPLHTHDELGFLVESFNEMTRQIALSRDEVSSSQQQVERERAYLRAVLGRLSSGVMTLDRRRRIRTANAASSQILGIDLKAYVGQPLSKLREQQEWLRVFVDTLLQHMGEPDKEWREEITILGHQGRQVLMCGGAAMASGQGRKAGDVIVFDDVTTLLQAQRDAAWGEVARRLAHEIKNPLTPIQLSAERLRQRYLNSLPAQEAELLDRSTHTIIQQVETLKEMVKAFSEYAHAPRLNMVPLSLNTVINEVLDLYREAVAGVKIQAELDPRLPAIEADVGRMRQLLHNLFKNAIEALQDLPAAEIVVTTRTVGEGAASKVEMTVEDNGPGISEKMLGHVFEPYVTSKPKGSGLGLAIVKKIVEEHGGVIRAINSRQGGVCIVMQLPAAAATVIDVGRADGPGQAGSVVSERQSEV